MSGDCLCLRLYSNELKTRAVVCTSHWVQTSGAQHDGPTQSESTHTIVQYWGQTIDTSVTNLNIKRMKI